MDDLDDFTHETDPARLRIVGTWLVEESDECTGGACGLGYGHEPGCGQEPIVDLSTVPGWGDLVAPLIEARVREARAEAWDETAEEAYGWGWLHGWALADVKGRNPYREDEDNG